MKLLGLSAVLSATAACPWPAQGQTVQPAADDGRSAAEANRQKLVAAFAKGDAAAVAALHYPDARLLPDNEQPASGSQEIRAYWQGLMKAGTRLVRPEARHTDAGA